MNTQPLFQTRNKKTGRSKNEFEEVMVCCVGKGLVVKRGEQEAEKRQTMFTNKQLTGPWRGPSLTKTRQEHSYLP